LKYLGSLAYFSTYQTECQALGDAGVEGVPDGLRFGEMTLFRDAGRECGCGSRAFFQTRRPDKELRARLFAMLDFVRRQRDFVSAYFLN